MSSNQGSSSSSSDTPRVNKRQPIIIQNVDLMAPEKARFKRKSLAVANLYLSAVMLSRQGVGTKGVVEHRKLQAGETLGDVDETNPKQYKDFGHSSAITGQCSTLSFQDPVEKLKLKKQVTFIEDLHSSFAVSKLNARTSSALNKRQSRSAFSKASDQVQRSNDGVEDYSKQEKAAHCEGFAPPTISSSAGREKSGYFAPDRECTPDKVNSSFIRDSINHGVTSNHSSALISPNSSHSEYPSINGSREYSMTSLDYHFGALDGNDTNDKSSQGNSKQSNIDSVHASSKTHADNENKAAPEVNLTWYQREKSAIESALNLNSNELLLNHSTDSKTRHFTSENTTTKIDTVVKPLETMQLESDTNNTRNVLRVHFLKEAVMTPRLHSSLFRQRTFNTNFNAPKDNYVQDFGEHTNNMNLEKKGAKVEDSYFHVSHRLGNNSHSESASSEFNPLVENNSKYLMQKYSFLGERRSNPDSHLTAVDDFCVGQLQLKTSDRDKREPVPLPGGLAPTGWRDRQTSNLSEAEFLKQRARSCSAFDRRPSPQASSGLYRNSDRYFLGSDISHSVRTARNRLLEEFILESTRSRHQMTVQKRLQSACRSK